jgi:predicted SPOUT superfamily RNA methylase MTH1
LRTPHHPLSDKTESLKIGEHREGVVTSVVKGGSLVDIGVERPVLVSIAPSAQQSSHGESNRAGETS